MFEDLKKVVQRLQSMPEELSKWNSLYVDYEKLLVERLWIQDGESRIYAHKIHPCEDAFYHPHTWPSSILLLGGGRYKMDVGTENNIVMSSVLSNFSHYEMKNIDGWHSVQPLDSPIFSIMVTGKPLDKDCDYDKFKSIPQQRPMTREERILFIIDFMREFRKLPANFSLGVEG